MKQLAFIAFALGLSACASTGEPAGETVATVKDGAIETAEAKQICRKETPTGQTIPVKTCRTREEWAAYDKSTVEGRRGHEEVLKRDGGYIK